MADVAIPAPTSLECSPDPFPCWPDAVGADADLTAHFGAEGARGFYVATEGLLVVTARNGNRRSLPVSSGGFYAIRTLQVWAAGSTAYGLIFVG